MLIRKLSIAAAAVGALAAAGPVAGASADTTPAATQSPVPSPVLTFVPPRVGPICVTIGPIIIGGKMINPGVHVCLAGVSLPPIVSSPTS